MLVVNLLFVPVVAVLATALPEELVYRGALLRLLAERSRPRSSTARSPGTLTSSAVTAGTLTSLLFADAHLPALRDAGPTAPDTVLRLALLTVFGLLMAWSVLRTGALWIALGWHTGGNAAGIVASVVLGTGAGWQVTPQEVGGLVIELVVLLALAELCARSLRRDSHDTPRP